MYRATLHFGWLLASYLCTLAERRGRRTRTRRNFSKFFFPRDTYLASLLTSHFSRGGEGKGGRRQGRRPARYRKESLCFSFARSSVPVSHNDDMT